MKLTKEAEAKTPAITEQNSSPPLEFDETKLEEITLTLPTDLLDALSDVHLALLKKLPRLERGDFDLDSLIAHCISRTLPTFRKPSGELFGVRLLPSQVPAPPPLSESKPNLARGENSELFNRTVKKTLEINLVFEAAIELIKTERKDQSRKRKITDPLTSGGIFNELLEAAFNRPEYAAYLAAAHQSFSPSKETTGQDLPASRSSLTI